jgi:predicted naringenin-chalcone synthase
MAEQVKIRTPSTAVAAISGVGTAPPPLAIEQRKAADLAQAFCTGGAESQRRLKILFRASGVRRRGSVILDSAQQNELPRFYRVADNGQAHSPTTAERMAAFAEHAPPMATAAAKAALADAGLQPGSVTHLVTVTCTGFVSPGIDAALIERLGLRRDIERVQVGFMGCHGTINALRVARGLVQGNPDALALVVAVELCSLHYAKGDDPERLVGNALFADGAAAAVIAPIASETAPPPLRLIDTGSWQFAQTADAMSWRIGDHGFVMGLDDAVPDLLHEHLKPPLTAWLEQRGCRLDDIRGWLVHPGGPRILDAVQETFGLQKETLAPSRAVLADHGNMSSATVLFVLERWRVAGGSGPALLLAFGPGLVGEFALLDG